MGVPQKDAVIPEDSPTELLLQKHVNFIAEYGKDKATIYDYEVSEFLRLNGVYWALTALDVMNNMDKMKEENVLMFLNQCYHEDVGAYGPFPNHDPHLLFTLSAVQIAAMYDAVDLLEMDRIENYIVNLQQSDGSFCGDKWGEVDTRFSFCAIATLSIMGKLERPKINLQKAIDFVCSCMNFDGGFGTRPGSESHAGQIYCCVAFLSIVRQLHRVDADLLGWWLSERQLPSGGLNGRPEKLPDVCYSWWVLSTLSILGRTSWIDADSLTKFILASQDDETGGISDRPKDYPDPFHTLFGVVGISLLGTHKDHSLKTINPVYCLPQYVTDRLGLRPQILSL